MEMHRDWDKLRADAVSAATFAVMREALRMTSGTMNAAMRRKRDYPYARRHGPQGKVSVMPFGPAMINIGTGKVHASWRMRQPSPARTSKVTGRVFNMVRTWDYLITQPKRRKSIYRPLDLYLTRYAAKVLRQSAEAAAQRFERKWR